MDLSTPNSHTAQPARRMRLGTRSCAECRRRRVKCIFDPGNRSCQNCIAHRTPCRAQQPKSLSSVIGSKSDMSLEQRMNELERAIDLINNSTARSTTESSSVTNEDISPTNASEVLQTATVRASRRPSNVSVGEITLRPALKPRLANAPILDVLKQVMNVQEVQEKVYVQAPRFRNLHTIVDGLRHLIPAPNSLTVIFESSQPYWFLWQPLLPFSKANPSLQDPQQPARAATEFTLQSLHSHNPTVVAMAVICFALCVQQISAKVRDLNIEFSAPLDVVLDRCLSDTTVLLTSEEAAQDVILFMETLSLHTKLCIDMGKPRQAWLSIRRAMNHALLQGFHKVKTRMNHQALWSNIWQTDRQLSLILGIPPVTSDRYIGSSSGLTGPARLMHSLSLIAGHIAEWSQTDEPMDDSVGLKIEQDLLRCRAEAALQWWTNTPSSVGIPLEAVYFEFVAKIYYYQLTKTFHLPYLLKSTADARFMQNRIKCLAACRDMISKYTALRASSQLASLICDLMDFQVFSAALVLVINLLSPPTVSSINSISAAPPQDNQQDWVTIQNLTTLLRTLSQTMECSVAAQAAQLLEYLYLAGHGQYAGMKDYEAAIPYFGKVRISNVGVQNWSQREESRTELLSSTRTADLAMSMKSALSGASASGITPAPIDTIPAGTSSAPGANASIVFSANYFSPFIQSPTAEPGRGTEPNYFQDAELGSDWTAAFDSGRDFDWNWTFDRSGE